MNIFYEQARGDISILRFSKKNSFGTIFEIFYLIDFYIVENWVELFRLIN